MTKKSKKLQESRFLFKPLDDENRYGYTELSAWTPSAESTYPQALLALRRHIVEAREGLNFPEGYHPAASSWFADESTALYNINEGSWFWPRLMAPRDTISRDAFYARNHDVGVTIWRNVFELEKYLGSYLITRNRQIKEHHLNDPINFFLLDVKKIIRQLTVEQNLEKALAIADELSAYIVRVKKKLPRTGIDRILVNKLLSEIKHSVKPDIKAVLEARNQRQQFEKIDMGLQKIILDARVITDRAFNDKPMLPHTHEWRDGEELQGFLSKSSHQALLSCAEESAIVRSRAVVTQQDGYQLTPLYVQKDDGRFEVNAKLVDYCEGVHLMPSASASDKKSFVKAIAQVEQLKRYRVIAADIIKIFEKAGQYNTVLMLQEPMVKFLKGLKGELKHTKAVLDDVLKRNEDLKNQLLMKHSRSKSWLERLTDLLSDVDEAEVNFIANQQEISVLTDTEVDGVQGYVDTTDRIDKLIDSMSSLARELQTDALKDETNAFVRNLLHSMETIVRGSLLASAKIQLQSIPVISSAEEVAPEPASQPSQPKIGQGPTGTIIEQPHALPTSSTLTKPVVHAESARLSPLPQQEKSAQKPVNMQTHTMSHCVDSFDKATGTYEKICLAPGVKVTIVRQPLRPLKLPSQVALASESLQQQQQPTPFNGDSYDLSTCKAVSFKGQEAVYCEGSESVMYYQASPPAIQQFIDQASANFALGMVVVEWAKGAWQWVFKEAEVIQAPTKKYYQQTLDTLYQNLSQISSRATNDTWAKDNVDIYYQELSQVERDYKRGQLDKKRLDSLKESVSYFLASVTPLEREVALAALTQIKQDLIAKTKVSEKDLQFLHEFYVGLAVRQHFKIPQLPSTLQAQYRELIERYTIEPSTFMDLAKVYADILAIEKSTAPMMQSDMLDAKSMVEDLLIKPRSCEFIDVELTIADNIERLRNESHPWEYGRSVTTVAIRPNIGLFFASSGLGGRAMHALPAQTPSQESFELTMKPKLAIHPT